MRASLLNINIATKAKAHEIIDKLDIARHLFGLEEIDIKYLRNAVGKIRIFDLVKGRLCGFWESPSKLAGEWKIEARRLRRTEERLESKGIIGRTSFSNGK